MCMSGTIWMVNDVGCGLSLKRPLLLVRGMCVIPSRNNRSEPFNSLMSNKKPFLNSYL